MNIQAMMKQAQKLQKEMLQTKSEIDNKTFEITKSFMSLKMKGNKTIEKETEEKMGKYTKGMPGLF